MCRPLDATLITQPWHAEPLPPLAGLKIDLLYQWLVPYGIGAFDRWDFLGGRAMLVGEKLHHALIADTLNRRQELGQRHDIILKNRIYYSTLIYSFLSSNGSLE